MPEHNLFEIPVGRISHLAVTSTSLNIKPYRPNSIDRYLKRISVLILRICHSSYLFNISESRNIRYFFVLGNSTTPQGANKNYVSCFKFMPG